MKRPISGLMALSVLLSGVTVHARFDIKPQANGKVSLQVCDSAIRKGVTYEITSDKNSMKATLIGQEDMGCTETINVTSLFASAGATLTVKKLNGTYDIDSAKVPGGSTGNNGGNSNGGNQQPPSALNSKLEIKKNNAGGATVSLCNVKDGTKVIFQLDDGSENEFTPKAITAADGCAELTYDSHIVNAGYKVVVTANGIMKSEKLGSNTNSGGNSGNNNGGNNGGGNNNGGNTGGTNNGGGNNSGTTQQPPAPQLKKVSEYEIRSNAKQAADNFMNEVVDYYGTIQMVRENVRDGFDSAEEAFQNLSGDYTSIPTYNQGKQMGLSDGKTKGFAYGADEGANAGSTLGRGNAVKRFEQVVNTGKAPDLTYTEYTSSYAGRNPNVTEPTKVRAQLKSKEDKIAKIAESELKQRSVGIIIDGTFVELFPTEKMWSPSFKDELKNYWSSDKADSAYSFWRNRTDARINTKVTAQHKFLAMISGNDYETPTANQNLFRETFKERYNEMFISKWNDRASTRVSYIQKEARAMYWEVVTGYARDLGYNHGYEQAFRPASIEGYKQTFAPSQKAAFDNAVQRYSTKEVITQVMTSFENASLKTSPRPRSGAPGDQIKFSINSVTNLATVPATLEVTVLNAKLASYSIGASTKTNKPKDYGVVAALPNDFPFDAKIISQKISINGTVGDYSQSQSFEITLRGYLQKLSMMPNGQEKYNYGLMLVAALRAEWTPASDGDDYDNKDGTLLHQVVAVVAQLTPQDRAAIKTLVPAIKSAYPSERPGFFSGVRDDWDAAMKLIEKIEKN